MINKSHEITQVAELIFNTLLDHMDDDQVQQYSNVFNRGETDPDVVMLANQILNGGE